MNMLKRRREKKTDYKQRLALLKSNSQRLVVRRSLNHIHMQIISFDGNTDRVILESSTKELKKYGWIAHCGNTSAAYLAGLLFGANAKKQGIKNLILDIGLHTSVKGSSLYAAALGIKDAGVEMPVGSGIIPDKSRITGKHIADYAGKLKKDSSEKYKKQFSAYIKAGVDPEKITDHFNEVKKKISDEFGIAAKEKSSKKDDE
ncbi:50S ribosomal protein L18 [archaeon]|nr:50S ribosomal protein L18 [archaeon]